MKKNAHRIFIGIDPGKGGGLVRIKMDKDGCFMPKSYEAIKMPAYTGDLYNFLIDGVDVRHRATVFVEQLVGNSGEASAYAMFKLGESYGKLLGACEIAQNRLGACFHCEQVAPQTWQKTITSLTRRKNFTSQSAWKNHLKQRAIELVHPKQYLFTSDAALILYYALSLDGLAEQYDVEARQSFETKKKAPPKEEHSAP